MATKWIGELACKWCEKESRVGIEKDGEGRTYRVMCGYCGIVEQAGFSTAAGQQIAKALEQAANGAGSDGNEVDAWMTGGDINTLFPSRS